LFSANSRYIFNISKKTGIFTRVKMPVYRQSESCRGYSAGFLFCIIHCSLDRIFVMNYEAACADE